MDDADIVVSLRQVGIDRERCLTRGERRIELSGEPMHLAEIAMIERNLGVGGDRAAHQFDRRRKIAGLIGDDAPQMQRACMIGMGAQNVLAELLGLREPARLHMLLGQRQRLRKGQRHRSFGGSPCCPEPATGYPLPAPGRPMTSFLRDISGSIGMASETQNALSAIGFALARVLAHHSVNASNGRPVHCVVQRRDAEIPPSCLLSPGTPHRDIVPARTGASAAPCPCSDAWAQGPQPDTTQAPAAAAPADQQAASDEPIGNVATLTGSATVTRNNAATPLKLKDDIYLNDVVATAATSSLGITFNDATTFTLKANAQVTIDNYVYEDGGKNNSGIFDIAKGTVAFAAAAVAKTGNMQITTPTASLGIRGTTGVVEVPEGGAAATTANNIKLYPDADGRVGQIEVNDRQGRRLGALTQGASGFAIRGGPVVVLAARALPRCRSRSRRNRPRATRALCASCMRRRPSAGRS